MTLRPTAPNIVGRLALGPYRSRRAPLTSKSIRPSAEGCTTSRVAYLEGWFVLPQARRRGIGRRLIQRAEEWARGQGSTEFASDSASDDEASAAAHRAAGFEDIGLVRCYRKDL